MAALLHVVYSMAKRQKIEKQHAITNLKGEVNKYLLIFIVESSCRR